jgi:hypothetical protein
MIGLGLSCSMCGNEKIVPLKTGIVNEKTTLGEVVKEAGWIGQQNGAILDVYCSKKCAE